MTDAAPGHTRPACRWITVIDGRQLRRLRRQQGLTQADLARQAAISLTVVSRLERRPQATCRSRTLARLAAALGHPAADLTPPPQT
jgi:transcriptional regulator with XRE-family HTH domain